MGLFSRKKKSTGRTVMAAYDESMWRFPSQFVQPGERPVGQLVVRHSNEDYLANLSDKDRRAYALVDQLEVFPGSGTIGGTRGLGTIWFTDRQVIVGQAQHREDQSDLVIPYSQVSAVAVDPANSLLTIASEQGTMTVALLNAQGLEAARMLLDCWQGTR